MEIWHPVAHTEQTTRPALALRLPCPTGPDVHLCASDHCTLRSNSPYRLIIRTVHCTETLVYSSMLCVVWCWCYEVCGVPACCLCPDLFVCVPGVHRLLSQELGFSTLGGSSQMTVASLCMKSACTHTHTHTTPQGVM